MSVTVLATPLQPGQLIRDWKRSYLSGVALLTAAQKKDVLPLYVNRSPEEQDIAYEAIKLETVELAIAMLEEFIDGSPSPNVLQCQVSSETIPGRADKVLHASA